MIKYFLAHKNDLILLFTIAYTAAFTFAGFGERNAEFLYYTFIMVLLICGIVTYNRQLHLGFLILVSLSLLGFLHLLGGNFYNADGVRLYDVYFFDGFLRFDNIVHTFGTFIATLTLYSLLANMIDERIRQRYGVFALLLVLMAIGLGTLNELVEFFAVVFLGAAEQVGDYYNNALDLLFNTIGSILACIVIYVYRERPRFYQRLRDKMDRHRS